MADEDTTATYGTTSATWRSTSTTSCSHTYIYTYTYIYMHTYIQMAGEDTTADIWYNISHLAINIGDLGLAYQTLKIAVAADSTHPEAINNLAVRNHTCVWRIKECVCMYVSDRSSDSTHPEAINNLAVRNHTCVCVACVCVCVCVCVCLTCMHA